MESPLRRHRLHGSRAETTVGPHGWQAVGNRYRSCGNGHRAPGSVRPSGSCRRCEFPLLEPVEPLVQSCYCEQLAVCSPLPHLTVVKHQNLARADDRAQSVRYRVRRPPAHEHPQSVLNRGLDLSVDRARRLVEDQQGRIGSDRPRRSRETSKNPRRRRETRTWRRYCVKRASGPRAAKTNQ